MKVWVGKEKEGCHKGLVTLFVGNPRVSGVMIKKIMLQEYFQQIYFGAGLCTKINYGVVRYVLKNLNIPIVTLEVDIRDLHNVPYGVLNNSKVELIVTYTHPNYSILHKKSSCQIKLQSMVHPRILLISGVGVFSSVDTSLLETKKYVGDRVLL
jgi:hypothetical protein